MTAIFETFGLTDRWFMHAKTETEINSAKMLWIRALKPFDDKTVARAAERALTEYPKQAPSVGEFTGLCRTAPAHQDAGPRMLPAPRANLTRQQSEMAKIKRMLGMK